MAAPKIPALQGPLDDLHLIACHLGELVDLSERIATALEAMVVAGSSRTTPVRRAAA